MTDTDARAEYTAGLRALADLLDEHEGIPLPYHGTHSELCIFCDSKEQMADFARAVPGKLRKKVDEGSAVYGFELHGSIRGLKIVACTHRNEVCTRVVTGTREVTEAVPDPSVIVPLVEVTKTVEDVEWVCGPLLAEATA
jgi:hypothetical protein